MQINSIAVLGLGSIGTRHFLNVLELGHTAIGFDPDPQKREALNASIKEKFPNAKFEILEGQNEAINAAQAVIIASPHKYHFAALNSCVEGGKHCLVEKPLATTTNELESLLNAAKEKGLVTCVGFNMRFRPVVEKAKDIMPQVGRVFWARFICASYLPDWRAGQDYTANYTADPLTGGVIFDISHELDLAHYLLGGGEVVACTADNSGLLDIQSEDRAEITLKHDSGAVSQIHLDYITRPRQRRFECAGEHGLLDVNLQTHSLKFYDVNGALVVDATHAPSFNNYEYLEELKDFITAIETSRAPRCSAYDGLVNLEHILKAREIAGLPKS